MEAMQVSILFRNYVVLLPKGNIGKNFPKLNFKLRCMVLFKCIDKIKLPLSVVKARGLLYLSKILSFECTH
jgi:hypothetical protein